MTEEEDISHLEQEDPLSERYREKLIEAPAVTRSLERGNTALLCVDLQYFSAMPDKGLFKNSEVSPEYYFHQLEHVVLPNVQRFQSIFREADLEVIHTRIQSLTLDGRDRSPGYKSLDLHSPPGSKESEFLPEVAPAGDEIVINKTASGVFSSTNLEYVLRNLEISGLFVVGVFSNECVSSAVRGGCDLGFYMTMISDGCAAVTPELHESTIITLKDRYGRVMTTDEAIPLVEKATVEKATVEKATEEIT